MKKFKLTKKKRLTLNTFIAIASYIIILTLISGGFLNRQFTSLIIPIGINIILAVSLNLVTGFLGELSLGHAGFMSIGAYTGALITLNLDAPSYIAFPIAIIAAGVISAFFGFIIGMPVLRLNGDYLAIVTLGFGEIIKSVINSLEITNGAKGLSKIPLYSTYQNFTVVFVFVILTILIISNIMSSRHGRAITSIRDNSIAAASIGINVSKYKIMAFVISAFFAGVAGVLYAHNVGILKPTTFDYNKSIEILVFVVLGGMGSIKGSIIAAIILTVLPELLRDAADFRMLLYAVILIALMLFNQSGLKEKLFDQPFFQKIFKTKKESEI